MNTPARKNIGYEFSRNLVIFFLNSTAARIPFHAVRLFLYRRIITVGAGSSILMKATIRGFRITIGKGCVINSGVVLDGRGAELVWGISSMLLPYVRIGPWITILTPLNTRHAPVP